MCVCVLYSVRLFQVVTKNEMKRLKLMRFILAQKRCRRVVLCTRMCVFVIVGVGAIALSRVRQNQNRSLTSLYTPCFGMGVCMCVFLKCPILIAAIINLFSIDLFLILFAACLTYSCIHHIAYISVHSILYTLTITKNCVVFTDQYSV